MIIEANYYEQYKRDFALCNQPDQEAMEERDHSTINSIKRFDEFVSPVRRDVDMMKVRAFYKLVTNLLRIAPEELWDISIELDDTIPYVAIRLVFAGLTIDGGIDNDLRQVAFSLLSSADSFELNAIGEDLVCLATFKLFPEESECGNDDIKVL